MATVLKVQFEDEIYRLTLEAPLSFDTIVAVIHDALPHLTVESIATGLKYVDDEKELCSLTPLTIEDFLELAGPAGSRGRLLKLTLVPRPPAPSAPPAEAFGTDAARAVAVDPDETEMGQEQDDEEEEDEGGAWSPQGHHGFKPWRFFAHLRMLKESGILTPPMFASMAVHWLPMMTQRVADRVDKINKKVSEGIAPEFSTILNVLKDVAAQTPGLEAAACTLGEVFQSPAPKNLGEAILALLLELGAMTFEAQVQFAEVVAELLLPLLDQLPGKGGHHGHHGHGHGHHGHDHDGHHHGHGGSPRGFMHHHLVCDGCDCQGIAGPAFQCTVCPDFHFCGSCYSKKAAEHVAAFGTNPKHGFELLKGGKGWRRGCWRGGKGRGQDSAGDSGERGAEGKGKCGWWVRHGGEGSCHRGKHSEKKRKHCHRRERSHSQEQKQTLEQVPEAAAAAADSDNVVIVSDGTREMFAEKLAILRDMNLGSDEVNLQLLAANNGDVEHVAQLLLGM